MPESILITNDGGQQQVVTRDYFLEAFMAANHSTPFETAQAIVNLYRPYLDENDQARLQALASESVAQFLAD